MEYIDTWPPNAGNPVKETQNYPVDSSLTPNVFKFPLPSYVSFIHAPLQRTIS